MTIQTLFKGITTLVVACWLQASSAAENASAPQILEAYLNAAVSTVNEIYETKPDALERSTLIGQSGSNEYWVNSRQTTIEGKDSGAAYVVLIGFRPDSWVLDEFRRAGDFGEIAVEFSRTKTFRSGEKSTSTTTLIYEMVKVEDSWFIAAFRRLKVEDAEVKAWDEKSDNVNVATDGIGPQEVVKTQLDLLQGLPPQALYSASKKSEFLWQDTREARKGQGRVIATVMAISSASANLIVWKLSVLEQGAATATVKAEVVSDKNMAFTGLVFTLEKTSDKWLMSAAVATR